MHRTPPQGCRWQIKTPCIIKKTLLTLICAIALSGAASAQHPEKLIGLRAGLNVSNIEDSHSRAGFHVGLSGQVSLSKIAPMYFETGLYVSQKGAEDDGLKIRPLYLQIPVLLNYHIYLGQKFSIDPFTGFYYGVGIGGQASLTYKSGELGSVETTTSRDLFGNTGELKRSDLGCRVGVTISFTQHVNLSIGYESSLVNILKSTTDKVRNKNLTITVGGNF